MKNFVKFVCLLFVLSLFGGVTFGRYEDKSYFDVSVKLRPYDDIQKEIKDNLLNVPVFQTTKKIVLYVWDFDNKSGYNVGIGKIKDDISTILLESGKFKLVEDVAVQMALKEMNLAGTGFIDQSNLKEFGKRLGVQYIVYGSVNQNDLPGGEQNLSLVLKIIDVETTEIIWAYEIGLSRKNFRTSIDTVIEEAIIKSPSSLLREWNKINGDSMDTYGKPIKTISVFFVNSSSGIDEKAVVDKMTSALLQAKITNVKIIDRDNLRKIIDQISKEGYEESAFYQTKKEFGKFYGVDAFLYGTITRDKDTGKTELNLKLAMVESGTVDWGRKFSSEWGPAEQESLGKISQEKFSKGVSETADLAWTALLYILTAPGFGVDISLGWLGGFTTPGFTSKSTYNGYDLFKDQYQFLSGNLSIDFFRIRIWKHLYLQTGIKLWSGSYTTPEEDYYSTEPLLTQNSFGGKTLTLSIKYSLPGEFFLKLSTLVLIPEVFTIYSSMKAEWYSYSDSTHYFYSNYVSIPQNGTFQSPLNWPIELEFGSGSDEDLPFSLSIVAGIWFPEGVRDYEWELGFNIKIPILWIHPFTLLAGDKEMYVGD